MLRFIVLARRVAALALLLAAGPLAGLAGSPGAADGPGAMARFNNPGGMAVDATGTVYVADHDHHTIRRIR